jgi:hypothetical protein
MALQGLRKQNQTTYPLLFQLISLSTGLGVPSVASSLVALGSKNGGAFAALSGTITEVGGTGNGNGWYEIAGNATDENTLGDLVILATLTVVSTVTATGSAVYEIVAVDPFSTTNFATVNVGTINGQIASASGTITFPSSIGTSTLTQSQVTGYAGPILTDNSTGLVSANATKIGGQTASAAGTVTFPSNIGTSTLTQAQVSGYAGPILTDNSTGLVTANATKIGGQTASASGTISFPSSIGTSTYAGADTSGTTTLLSRVPGTVQPQTGDSYARLGAPVGASNSADIAAVKSSVGSPQQSGSSVTLPTGTGSGQINLSGGNVSLASGTQVDLVNSPNATALIAIGAAVMGLANAIDGTFTPAQAMNLILAASAAKLSGANTTSVVIRDTQDTKNRISATVDQYGNRSAVALNAT